MNIKEWCYFKFQELTPEIRTKNKMKPDTKNRLDCVSAYTPNIDLRGLTFFVNNKNQMYLYKTPAREISKADLKRQASWMLTGHANGLSINLSSIFIDVPEYPQYAYGNPPYQKMIGRGKKPNPLFSFRNDLYLFILNSDYTEIELIIIPEQKNLWNQYYIKLIQGEFTDVIKHLRENASAFFDYSNK